MSTSSYEWVGELSDVGGALAALTTTGTYEVLGQTFAVPVRGDYDAAFVAAGLLDGQDLGEVPALAAAAQAHWHAAGHNACVFAARMSGAREENGWETVVLGGGGTPEEEAVALARIVGPRLVAAEAEVVSVLLPHRDDPAELAALLHRLSQLSGWSITDEGEEDDPEHGTVVRLGLRVQVDFAFASEVLGFGPYSCFGATRRAPFTELLIRAKPPTKRPKHKRAFVAHYQIPGLASHETGLWRTQTSANRVARLGPEHNDRAKARVTAALPKENWITVNS